MEKAVTLPAARAISNVIQDAQERLIFCANSMLTKQVVRFKAKPADLDYPEKLIKQKEEKEKKNDSTSTTDAEQQLEQAYLSWFPPMRTVLRVLSKIFRVVEPVVFEDMARTSVQACTKSLSEGAVYIKKRSGDLDGDLFLVKHLLILREQLSPFDLEWQTVERQLDFSDAGKAVARFWANRNRRVFSMSTSENALVSLLREGVSVQESRIDSKRDLEEALRSACNDFISHTTGDLIGEISDLVAKCRSSESQSITIQSYLGPASALPLLEKTVEGMAPVLEKLRKKMTLYLESSATQNILLKPVSRRVVRTTEEFKKLMEMCEGWDPEQKSTAASLISQIEGAAKGVYARSSA